MSLVSGMERGGDEAAGRGSSAGRGSPARVVCAHPRGSGPSLTPKKDAELLRVDSEREVGRRGRPPTDTGWRAYTLKAAGGRTWASIARELGLSDARRGDVAMGMAKRYAKREGLPWPNLRTPAGANISQADGLTFFATNTGSAA